MSIVDPMRLALDCILRFEVVFLFVNANSTLDAFQFKQVICFGLANWRTTEKRNEHEDGGKKPPLMLQVIAIDKRIIIEIKFSEKPTTHNGRTECE